MDVLQINVIRACTLRYRGLQVMLKQSQSSTFHLCNDVTLPDGCLLTQAGCEYLLPRLLAVLWD